MGLALAMAHGFGGGTFLLGFIATSFCKLVSSTSDSSEDLVLHDSHWNLFDCIILFTIFLCLSTTWFLGCKCGAGKHSTTTRNVGVQCDLLINPADLQAPSPPLCGTYSKTSALTADQIHFSWTGEKYHTDRHCFHIKNNVKVVSRTACAHCQKRWL